VLSPLNLAEETKDPVKYSHLLAEVFKRGYADRSEVIGDPNFVKTDYSYLLSPSYADGIRKELNREKATPSSEIRPGRRPNQETHGTSHLSLIDDKGNAISATLTINTSFGAMLPVPGTGIFLNNEMDDFSSKPGEKNVYGLTGSDANAIAPGKRPVSSMMPTILLKDGKPVMAVGGAGGSRIITSTIQVILNQVAVRPGDLRYAVSAPRIHHQWVPDKLDLEEGFSGAEALKAMGHQTGPWDWLAEVQAVARGNDGKLTAVYDRRGWGGAAAQ
jgi:gamma-glutamyltranspeptidase/glutathione hydrolase